MVTASSLPVPVGGLTRPAATESRLLRADLGRLDEVSASLAATAAEYDRTGSFPHAPLQLVHEAGLLTAGVDAKYGGSGVSFTDVTKILLALGRGDPSTALIAGMTIVPHLLQTRSPWPEELYARVLEESALRPTLLNHARAEPEMGSSTRGGLPATTARRTANGWSIRGRKRFVTGAEGLSYFLVWAATDEASPRVGNFVVPARTPGIEIVPTWHQLGMRATGSHEVRFTDVEIPAEYVHELEAPGAAPVAGRLPGTIMLLLSSALYLGVARAAQQYVHTFAHERVPAALGRSLATTDRVRQAAGEIETLLAGAEQLIFGVADRVDRGVPVGGVDALAAKVVVVRHVTTAVQTGLRLLGNPGLAQANPLERHFRDIQSVGVHAPQEDAALAVIGAAALAKEAPGA
ncbi:acyl-CoA dehydrogenase family protein [Streptomyces sp. NPDC087420]|uniref:acyl-CoA dehydrogenase family protein n=1 Tax=Streptomyces sp. NPDC087420 TaxID=3365785 RepID=UPI003834C680